jgi:hypothetical protein
MTSSDTLTIELDVSKVGSDMLVALETVFASRFVLKSGGQWLSAPLCVAMDMQLQTPKGDIAKLTISRDALKILGIAASSGAMVELRGG